MTIYLFFHQQTRHSHYKQSKDEMKINGSIRGENDICNRDNWENPD
jgi:hypothetical protein